MSSSTDEVDNEHQNGRHVIFVDGAGEANQQVYDEDIVDAATIIQNAGYHESPGQYVLEALRGQSGDVQEQFDPDEEVGPSEVDLTGRHRKHFQVITQGDIFI